MKQRKSFGYYFLRNKNGMIGLIGVALIVILGVIAPFLVAYPEGYTCLLYTSHIQGDRAPGKGCG